MEKQAILPRQTWERFVENEALEAGLVRPYIEQSWQRCRGLSVDPFSSARGDLKGAVLSERRRDSGCLVEVARPFMQTIYGFIRGSGFEVVLADDEGFLLEVVGDPGIVKSTRRIQLCPGGNWSEELKGTNAIGTALAAKSPVRVHGHEHFCMPHHYLTCSAAPIFDTEGRLVGVLDVTGDSRAANPHSLGMVVAAVNAIEAGLRLRRTSTRTIMDLGARPGAAVDAAAPRGQNDGRASARTHASGAQYVFEDIIGESGPMRDAKGLALTAARSSSSVLLVGESGTGKELFAQAIHNAGPRRNGPFVAVHCAALPESLIESELFGYEEGAFTGSRKCGRKGRFEQADGGTLFLDEIGDVPPATQAKLLRVIQERRVVRLGGDGETPVDIRIIAATNKDLKGLALMGAFRRDLYYRLNVITINIPPLRERAGDAALLTAAFVEKMAGRLGKREVAFDGSFLTRVRSYPWPGNVRELENAIERAVNVMDDGQPLTAGCLTLDAPPPPPAPADVRQARVRSLDEVERDCICRAIALCKGNLSQAASGLGIGRNTLYRKIKAYRIPVQAEKTNIES